MYKFIIKSFLDFVLASVLLLLLSPLIFAVIFFLAITNKGAVFFLQSRPGYNSIPFKIIKFKTMRDAFDENGKPLPDQYRITLIGKCIRSLSIDEILQLVNVLKGEMSIVGPRPLLMQYISRYTPFQARRHEVKPGITGWAQVNGRNSITWEDKFKLDVEYVDNLSLILDMKIIWLTFLAVIKRKNVNSNNHVTMEEFIGNKLD